MNRQTLIHGLKALGLPGALGVLLMLLAAWVNGAWVPSQKAELDTMSSDVRRLRHELLAQQATQAGNSTKGALTGLSPEQAWQLVWDALPDETQRLNLLSAVTTSAVKMGVVVSAVQYHGAIEPWSVREDQALWRQRMVMPVEGRYADLRMWLAQLLRQPNLSVDVLDINRADTMTDMVKGRVSVSLWWRAPKEAP